MVRELCRKHDRLGPNLYVWEAKAGGLAASEARRLVAPEVENARLKRLLADAMLDNEGPTDLLRRSGGAATSVGGRASQNGVQNERVSRSVIGVDRTTVHYQARRADDGELRSRLRDLAAKRRRFGYRRLHVLLRREGVTMRRK